jgi:hypothetical protein
MEMDKRLLKAAKEILWDIDGKENEAAVVEYMRRTRGRAHFNLCMAGDDVGGATIDIHPDDINQVLEILGYRVRKESHLLHGQLGELFVKIPA